MDDAYWQLGTKYIDHSNVELLDAHPVTEKIFSMRVNQIIRDFFIDIKKIVSFVGIYMITDDVEDLDRQMKKYKKTMSTAFKMLTKHQDTILDQQVKRQKKKTMGKV